MAIVARGWSHSLFNNTTRWLMGPCSRAQLRTRQGQGLWMQAVPHNRCRPGEGQDPLPRMLVVARGWGHIPLHHRMRWLWVLVFARATDGWCVTANPTARSAFRQLQLDA